MKTRAIRKEKETILQPKHRRLAHKIEAMMHIEAHPYDQGPSLQSRWRTLGYPPRRTSN
jgi:hypothetical protein